MTGSVESYSSSVLEQLVAGRRYGFEVGLLSSQFRFGFVRIGIGMMLAGFVLLCAAVARLDSTDLRTSGSVCVCFGCFCGSLVKFFFGPFSVCFAGIYREGLRL